MHTVSCYDMLNHVFYYLITVVAWYVYFSFQKNCKSPGKFKKSKQSFKMGFFLTNKCVVHQKKNYFVASVDNSTSPTGSKCVVADGDKGLAYCTKIQWCINIIESCYEIFS